MPQVADLPSVETVEPVGGADVQQYVTYVRLQDQAIYKDEVLPNRGYEARTAAWQLSNNL